MKRKNLVGFAVAAAVLTATPFSLQTYAYEGAYLETSTENKQVIAPRYAYVNSVFLAVDPSSSSVSYEIEIDGMADVTSISGTLTLYKENASGRFEKKTSKSIRATGDRLKYYGEFDSYGSGNYRLTFKGTVYVNGDSETISLSAEDSY